MPKVGEEQARFWDIWIKIGGGVIAIGTLIIGFNTLSRQGDQLQIQQKQFEATRDILDAGHFALDLKAKEIIRLTEAFLDKQQIK